jgi:universal stress protein E
MQRFKKILFVAGGPDGGAAALERAVSLARNNQAQLMAIDVVRQTPSDLRTLIDAAVTAPENLQQQLVLDSSARLEALVAPYRDAGLEIETKVQCGTPSLEITQEVLRSGHDLVIKTAEDSRGLKRMLFGSTDRQLLRNCPCPVWVHKAGTASRYRRILAAIDPGASTDMPPDAQPEERTRLALSQLILQLAVSLAESEGGELHVLHVWSLFSEQFLRTAMGTSPEEVDRAVKQVEREHRRRLDALLAPFQAQHDVSRIHVIKGDPGDVIPELAEREGIDLIVMGTVCRTGIAGFLIGNTAERVLNQIDAAVLTVKPEGFVTPVRLDDERG